MGKSAKKSASKVESAPAVVAPTKSMKKGKRDAEEIVVKEVVSSKKQKVVNGGVTQAIEKKKVETKTQKKNAKKQESSSSEEDSDSDEEPKKVVSPAKKAVPVAKKPVKESSSDDSDSPSDEEPQPKKQSAPAAKKVPVTKPESSSDESESDDSDSSDDEEAKKPTVAAKNGAVAAKKAESSDESDSDDSSDEEDAKAAKKPTVVKNGAGATPAKKAESSDDSSSEESDSEEKVKAAPAAKKPAPVAAAKKAESSDESSEEESSEDEEPQKKKAKPAETKPNAKVEESSSEEEESSDDEEPAKPQAVAKADEKKDSSSEEESEEESDEDEKPAKKKGGDVEMVDAPSAKKAPQTPATPKTGGSKTLFMGNLKFRIQESDVLEFFKSAGEVVEVRFAVRDDGRFAGYGHVEFATPEAAQEALKLSEEMLLDRPIRLDFAKERNERSFQKSGGGQTFSIYIRGFGHDDDFDTVRASLEEHFGQCGEIARLSIPKDYESGGHKGVAFIDFNDSAALNKALELSGTEVAGGTLTVEDAKSKRFGGRDGGGFSGGRGGRGGRGGHGFNRPSMATPGTVMSGDDDLPNRDHIGERRRKHENRGLASAGIQFNDDDELQNDETTLDGIIDTNKDGLLQQLECQKLWFHINYDMDKNRGLTCKSNNELKKPRKKYNLKHKKKEVAWKRAGT